MEEGYDLAGDDDRPRRARVVRRTPPAAGPDGPAASRRRRAEPPRPEDFTDSRLYGGLLILLGVAMGVGFFLVGTAPKRLFVLLGAGGATSAWLGLGFVLFPLPPRLFAMIKDQSESAVTQFREVPPVWKAWLPLAVAVAAGVGFLVNRVIVPAGR